jgi:hypothetical protein
MRYERQHSWTFQLTLAKERVDFAGTPAGDELPPQQAAEYRQTLMIFPKVVTPNVSIRGPVRVSPGFPLKACGNDGLWENQELPLRSKLRGIDPKR